MPISTPTTVITADGSHPGYVSGDYYLSPREMVSDTSSASAWAVNSITYTPVRIFYDTTIIRLAVNCATAKTSADGRFGFYSNVNGRPANLLCDSTPVSFQTTGIKEFVLNLSLTKGWVWLWGTCNITPIISTVSQMMGSNAFLGQTTPSAAIANVSLRHTAASPFASPPSVAPLSNLSRIAGALMPIVWYKIQ